jgi:hypothetical protein
MFREKRVKYYAEESVRQGVELLRLHIAPLHLVNLDELDMGHVSKCILARTYGSYGKGKNILGLKTNESGVTFGFWYPRQFVPREYYTILTEVWKTVLKELT